MNKYFSCPLINFKFKSYSKKMVPKQDCDNFDEHIYI